MKTNIIRSILLAFFILLSFSTVSLAEEKAKKSDEFAIPSHVLDISRENTHPNPEGDFESVEPSELTKELLSTTEVGIDNSDLIQLLNETSLKPSPIAIGYRGMVYLGRWPLNYESTETKVNWEYRPINKNELNNIGGDTQQQMNYVQQENKEIKGTLLNKIASPDVVRRMMLEKTKEKTNLPLAYETVIGKNTKKENAYAVPMKKLGELQAYAPAVNEKGQITFGEVYIELKGSKKQLVIKNVTKQGIAAWMPIQNHVSFSFQLK